MRRCLENIIETYKMMKINKIIVLLIIGVSLAGDIQALSKRKKPMIKMKNYTDAQNHQKKQG